MRRQAGRLQRADGRWHEHLTVERTMIRDVVFARHAAEEIDGFFQRFRADFFIRMIFRQVFDGCQRILYEFMVFVIAEHVDHAAVERQRAFAICQERDGLAALCGCECCREACETATDDDHIRTNHFAFPPFSCTFAFPSASSTRSPVTLKFSS